MIRLTEPAEKEVARLASKHQNSNVFFRLGVKQGGCCNLCYTMEFDDKVGPGDRIFECNSIQVAIDKGHLNYLEGLTLDYSEDLMGGGFRFKNPLATTACGCGNSFAVEG